MANDRGPTERTVAHRALWNIAHLHRPHKIGLDEFSVCQECEGFPEWPCETVRIVQEVIKDDLTFRDESFVDRMREIAGSGDTEGAHANADALMVRLLRDCGYEDAMDIYEAMPKWCA